jgi:hypothetical protein
MLIVYFSVLVDSPGVDVAQGMDEAIEDVCEDADLFVLVQNSEESSVLNRNN